MTYNFTTLISFYLLTEINITCGATFFTKSRQNIGTEYIMKCVQQILLCEREPTIIHFTTLIDNKRFMDERYDFRTIIIIYNTKSLYAY